MLPGEPSSQAPLRDGAGSASRLPEPGSRIRRRRRSRPCGIAGKLAVLPQSDLGAIEVQIGAGWGGATLILVPGAVDGRAVWVLRGGAGTEQAQLAYLHSRPEFDRQRRHVGQLERHVPGET